MPVEMRVKKNKLQTEALESKEKAESLKHEE